MIEGHIYTLSPFRKKVIKEVKDARELREIFDEEVKFIKMSISDNAIIKDHRGRKRLCNPKDLYPIA